MTKRSSWEDITAKAEWEGGLDVALEWFKPHEVPEEIEDAWRRAIELRQELEEKLAEIENRMESGEDE